MEDSPVKEMVVGLGLLFSMLLVMLDAKQPASSRRGNVPSYQEPAFTQSVTQLNRGGGSTKKRKRKTLVQSPTKKRKRHQPNAKNSHSQMQMAEIFAKSSMKIVRVSCDWTDL